MQGELNRRHFLKASAAAAVVAALPRELMSQNTPARRPNILVFLTDDHGQWAQGCYGNKEIKSPNLDALAAGGVRMTNAFTPCPVCSPARASFFTGRMPSQHGIHDWLYDRAQREGLPTLKNQTLLSDLLKEAGYHTGLVGKWHCGDERNPQSGFDRWFSYWNGQYPHRGTQHFSDEGKELIEEGQQSPLLTNHALDFLKNHRENTATSNKPFFLFVGYVDTHSPHQEAPDDLVAKYENASFSDIPDEHFSKAHGTTSIVRSKDETKEHAKLRQYYAAVSSIDREVGRVVADLKANGQFENTLIVYTGDHGLNTGHHGFWEKGNATTPQNFIDESIRIACTLHWPQSTWKPGTVSQAMVTHCDLFATLLDVAQAAPKPEVAKQIDSPGRSYVPELLGRASDARDAVFLEYGNARAIRTDSFKLILRYPYKGVTFANELYDLKSDPRETTNVYDLPAHAEAVKTLTERINTYFARYTITGHDGLQLEQLPAFNGGSEPWVAAAKAVKATTGKS